VKQCTLPLTGIGVVNMIVTELSVIDITRQGLLLREIAPGFSPEDVQKATAPSPLLAPGLKTLSV
jgi:acyl CoA:acetate/3-ketoacid CoA transferase beta subunit